jgi:hypothetical protein
MTAAARKSPRPSALEVFIARAWARAQLYAAGELNLHTATDPLWHAAERDGLLRELGADALQQLLADAFSEVR